MCVEVFCYCGNLCGWVVWKELCVSQEHRYFIFQVKELENSRESAIKEAETEEVNRLQRQVLSLEDQLADKTKVNALKMFLQTSPFEHNL